jgi:L-iditol 2-dehydrogenase
MKAIVLTGINQMELRDVPDPTVEKDNEVLLKIERVGVCGSDVHYYETGRIGRQIVEYPFIIGHECSATVKAIGSSVTGVKVGDQVAVDPAVSCHQCSQCRMGRENTCEDLRFLGCPGEGGGCLCEYIVMSQECCFPTNGAITLEQAALCEPLSIAVYAVKRAQIPEGASIGILGAGPIGLSVLSAAKAEKTQKIYLTEKIEARLEAARGVGVSWAGNPDRDDVVKDILASEPLGLDVVIECCGQQDALDQAFEILKPGGRLVIIGTARKERISFDIDTFKRKELSVNYIRRQNHCVQATLDLIQGGEVNVDFMITHHFPLEDTQKAFDLVAGYHDGVIKAMIHL